MAHGNLLGELLPQSLSLILDIIFDHLTLNMFSLALLTLALALAAKGDSWGPAYSLGPTNSAIIEAITTFTPGTPPSDAENYLFLWPGISNSTSGLIQAGTDQTGADQNSYCGASQDQWCAMASYYGVVDGVTTQLNGDMVPIDANASITIHYKLADDDVTWEQNVTLNGEVISTLTSSDGPLYNGGWGTGTECQQDCTGTTSPQYYKNTTITLLEADPDFSSTLSMGDGVEASTMVTSDDGKTWTIDSITIPAMVSDNSSSSSSSSKSTSAASSQNAIASTTLSRTSTARAIAISTSTILAEPSATLSQAISASEPNANSTMFPTAVSGSPVGGSASTSQPTGLLGDNQSSIQAFPNGGLEVSSFPTASSSADGFLPSGEAGDDGFGGSGNGSSTNETSGALPSDGAGSANATAAASGPAYSATSSSEFVKRFFRNKRQSESAAASTAASASALSTASASSSEAHSTNGPGESASESASSLPTNFPTSTFSTGGSFPSGSADGCACGGGFGGDDFGSASGSAFPTAVFGSAASLPTDVSGSAFSSGADDLSTAAAALPSGPGSAEGPFTSGEVSSGECDCNGTAGGFGGGGGSFSGANETPFPTVSNEGALPTGESGSPSQAGITESGSVATITTSGATSTTSGSGSVPSSSSSSSSNFRRVPRHGIWERLNRRAFSAALSATAGSNDPLTAPTATVPSHSSGKAGGSSDTLPTGISANSAPASFPTGDEGTGSEGPFPTASMSVDGSFPSGVSSSGVGGAEGGLGGDAGVFGGQGGFGGEGEASDDGEYSGSATADDSFPSSTGA
ncbi:hypothetical protein EV421DRAFT_2029831 [Armillaria borealis]|uniref:Uncharacterized protein n=1 Tax=Armillaria borealis TaxID=47425 RepID=A0AA39K5T8_9AGAR|nr:hypothetical protein EV421DRAFT_2029831 [Armillaria borealis]